MKSFRKNFQNLKNMQCGIRISWVKNFLKINIQGEISVRDLRIRIFKQPNRCVQVITCLIWRNLNQSYIFPFFLYALLMFKKSTQRKQKEEFERVHERNFQNSRNFFRNFRFGNCGLSNNPSTFIEKGKQING